MKRFFIRRNGKAACGALSFSLLALGHTPAQAERQAPQPLPKKRSIQLAPTPRPDATELEAYLNLGNIADGNRFDRPSQGLAFALRKYPKIQRFRLQWSMELEQTQIKSTLFYDRRGKVLTFYSAGEIFGAKTREHWRDRNVSDALLYRLADKAPKMPSADDSAHFKELVKMGSQREVLK